MDTNNIILFVTIMALGAVAIRNMYVNIRQQDQIDIQRTLKGAEQNISCGKAYTSPPIL